MRTYRLLDVLGSSAGSIYLITVRQRLMDQVASGASNPIGSQARDQTINLAGYHTECARAVPSHERNGSSQWRDYLRGRMSQCSWRCVSKAVNKPSHASVVCNEELSIGRLEPNPRKTREMANLEVPRLNM